MISGIMITETCMHGLRVLNMSKTFLEIRQLANLKLPDLIQGIQKNMATNPGSERSLVSYETKTLWQDASFWTVSPAKVELV